MPYIKSEDRLQFNSHIKPLAYLCNTVGDMNYVISRLLHMIIKRNRFNYDLLNSLIGVLECTKLEIYRQLVAPYERKKHELNGPISELDENGE